MGNDLSSGEIGGARRGGHFVRNREGDGQDGRAPTPEDRAWIEALGVAFEPPPMSGARGAAFDARLRERIDWRRARGWRGRAILLPGAVVAVAALASLFFRFGEFGTDLAIPSADDGVDGSLAGPALESWEQRLFYQDPSVSSVAVSAAEIGDDEGGTSPPDLEATQGLPAEYAALEWLLIEG